MNASNDNDGGSQPWSSQQTMSRNGSAFLPTQLRVIPTANGSTTALVLG